MRYDNLIKRHKKELADLLSARGKEWAKVDIDKDYSSYTKKWLERYRDLLQKQASETAGMIAFDFKT